MASPNFMRLSLMKAALADNGWSSVQEIRASRSFFARCGIPRTSTSVTGAPGSPKRTPGFPVELNGVGTLHAAFLDESRTRSRWWRPVQEIREPGPKMFFSNAFTRMLGELAGKAVSRQGTKQSLGFARSFSAHVRWGEHGVPVPHLRPWLEWKGLVSSQKGAHAALSSAAWQELRVRSGMTKCRVVYVPRPWSVG